MNNKLLKFVNIFLLVFGALTLVFAEGHKKDTNPGILQKPNGTPQDYRININKISTWIYGDGRSDIRNQVSGFTFPKGSNRQCFYQSGFVWGGKVNGEIRVGGTVYRTGLVPGVILGNGQPEPQTAPENRMYRVRRDWENGNLSAEVNDGEGTEAAIRAQYKKDWDEWPAAKGAPYTDVDGNGQYDPTKDIPGFPGADQTIWYAANDNNPEQSQYLYGSLPMGIEVQTTVWGYASTGALGNMIFRSYKMINKSQNDFTDFYVSMWSDPDNGSADDDLAGCDTVLSLGYIYNGKAKDDTYGFTPPAAGFDFFQGPAVPGNPEDEAIVDVVKKRKVAGKKNLGITAFYYFINSDPTYTDPEQGVYKTGTLQMYNLLQGKIGTTGEFFPIPDELGGGITKFPLSGDPTTGKGYVDGLLFPAGDRRIGMSSGPFTLAKGDTQEVVVAQIAAGNEDGIDRLGAVGLLKFYDQQAQQAYNNFFDLPPAPRQPAVNVSELNEEIVLDWGSNPSVYGETEASDVKGYKFEGYNVYQLPTASASKSEAIRIATFDVNNGVGKIIGPEFNSKSGIVTENVLQFGSDVGLQRYLRISSDVFNSGLPLVNGKRYFFAVTAYSYNPDPQAIPNTIENPLTVISGLDGKIGAVPQAAKPGVRYGGASGDTVVATRTKGSSDGVVSPIIVDPKLLTGHEYKITFDTAGGTLKWNLIDVTANNAVRLSNQTNITGDEEYPTADGMLIKVQGPPSPGMKDYVIPDGSTRRFTWAGGDWGSEGFNHAIGNAFDQWFSSSTIGYDKLANVEIRLAKTDENGVFDPNDPNASFGYRYVRAAQAPPAKPEFAQYIVNPSKSFAFQDFTKSVPLSAWNMETGKRLAIGFSENNSPGGLLNGRYWPGTADSNNIGTTGPREWLFIFANEYTEQADPALAVNILDETLPIMWFATINRRTAAAWPGGDLFQIISNHIITVNDEFAFTAPTTTQSIENAKVDVEDINVFPNPYYGANPEELNKYQRFVTISHLPQKATIRIFNLAGQLVRTIQKDTPEQYQRWDLANQSGLPVASGLYIIYVDMPDLGKTKIVKAAIIQEQQILDRF